MRMKRILSRAILMVMLAFGVNAQTPPDANELTRLLNGFWPEHRATIRLFA